MRKWRSLTALSSWARAESISRPPAGSGRENGFDVSNYIVIAPAKSGSYNFQWRMAQDGAERFGDTTPNVIEAIIIP